MKKMYLSLLLIFFSVISFAQVPGYVPTNSLVGWWPFNGNANDESGNGNNGTVLGNTTLTTDRYNLPNKSYYFPEDSNSFILTSFSGISGKNPRSMSLWFNQFDKTTTNTANSKMTIVGYGGDGFPAPNYSGSIYSVMIHLGFGNKYGLEIGASDAYCSVIDTGDWHHLVVVYDSLFGSNIISSKFYLDGQLQNYTYSFGTSVNLNTTLINSFRIGSGTSIFNYPFPFNGKIDDIGFWNRALTQQEITALYQGCNLNVNVNPATANAAIGTNASLAASGGTIYQWQTNPVNNGWQNVNNNSTYNGATTASLAVNNIQLQNHQQQFRVISGIGSCVDTAYALINVTDTCIITTSISVTDTLIINAVLSGVNPPNNTNTLLVYPNPARTHITIDNGNFALMNGYTVRINNALGQTVFTQAVNQQQFFIDLSSWTGSGLYYLNLIDNQGNSVETKVIVVQ